MEAKTMAVFRGMKRFWAFAGVSYYPAGGMGDSHASFETPEEAEAWALQQCASNQECWAHVWDMESDVEIVSFDKLALGVNRYALRSWREGKVEQL
jgi:hypothetical protein